MLTWTDAQNTSQTLTLLNGIKSGASTLVFSDGTQATVAQLAAVGLNEPVQSFQYAANSVVFGGKQSDYLSASGTGSVLRGGLGNDTVEANGSHQTIAYQRGDGVDLVRGYGSAAAVALEGNITLADLRLELDATGQVAVRVGPDAQDRMKLGIYTDNIANSKLIDRFTLEDGQSLSWAELVERGVQVLGTDQDNTLSGSDVNDEIHGGLGHNTLRGGAGADDYVIAAGSINVVDDNQGSNTLQLPGLNDWSGVTLSRPNASGNDLLANKVLNELKIVKYKVIHRIWPGLKRRPKFGGTELFHHHIAKTELAWNAERLIKYGETWKVPFTEFVESIRPDERNLIA